jgi:hypothetical protein
VDHAVACSRGPCCEVEFGATNLGRRVSGKWNDLTPVSPAAEGVQGTSRRSASACWFREPGCDRLRPPKAKAAARSLSRAMLRPSDCRGDRI